MTVDWLPVTGSTSEPNENPISVSSSEPATCRPANVAASPQANARPPQTSLTIMPPKASGSRSIVPCLTTGIRPTARPTAMTERTRPGIILLENSGARMNSGAILARTRKNAATCCSENRARSSLAVIGSAPDERRDLRPELGRPVDDRAEHPRAGDSDDRDEAQDLRDERERLLLDLRHCLEDRDQEAHDQAHEEHGERDLHGHAHHVHDQRDDLVLVHDMWKLWTSDEVTRFQPSTRMNSRILNGSEMKTGGSIIIPIDINVDETTRSMIRNGRKIRKPIWNAVLSSEMTKAGMRTVVGTSLRSLTFWRCPSLTNSATSLVRVCFHMNSRIGPSARLSATSWVMAPFLSGS